MAENSVKVSVHFKDGVGLAGESLWADPVDAHDGGGTYVLKNNSFYVPLAVGDLVRAELDGDGILQVTDVVQPAPVVMTSVAVAHGDHDTACAMGDRWREDGADWSEGMQGLLSTVWEAGVAADRAVAVVEPDVLAGRAELLWAAGPEGRTRQALDMVDFELDREQHFPPVETTYWAPDDAYWREVGLDSPDFLAYVQSLASRDEVIARALEAGDHDAFRQMFVFINGEAPF
jgi:hypothetical protein